MGILSMAKQISKFRLAVNGIGTAFIAILCLSVGLPGAVKLLLGAVHFGADPDSADKALELQVLSTGIGLILICFQDDPNYGKLWDSNNPWSVAHGENTSS